MISVAIKPLTDKEPILYGRFVGLMPPSTCDRCGSDNYTVVVQLDGHGMILSEFHPSRVVMLPATAAREHQEVVRV